MKYPADGRMDEWTNVVLGSWLLIVWPVWFVKMEMEMERMDESNGMCCGLWVVGIQNI